MTCHVQWCLYVVSEKFPVVHCLSRCTDCRLHRDFDYMCIYMWRYINYGLFNLFIDWESINNLQYHHTYTNILLPFSQLTVFCLLLDVGFPKIFPIFSVLYFRHSIYTGQFSDFFTPLFTGSCYWLFYISGIPLQDVYAPPIVLPSCIVPSPFSF